MSVGIAIYNTDNLSSQQAYTLAKQFFNMLGITITDAAYRSNDVPYTSFSPVELAKLLATNNQTDFRLYHKDSEHLPWLASFGHVTDLSGGFYHIDVQYAGSLDNHMLKSFLKQSAEITNMAYGIAYAKDNVVDAYEYVLDEGIVPVPAYEKPLIWRDETPGMFNGPARYKDRMLRMVYPYNIINSCHLNILVQGKPLAAWIAESPAHGRLTPLTAQLFLWEVAISELANINKICGEAGILVAWEG